MRKSEMEEIINILKEEIASLKVSKRVDARILSDLSLQIHVLEDSTEHLKCRLSDLNKMKIDDYNYFARKLIEAHHDMGRVDSVLSTQIGLILQYLKLEYNTAPRLENLDE